MIRLAHILLFFIGHMHFGLSQNKENGSIEDFSIEIQKAKDAIVLDGILNEQTWSDARVLTGFSQYFPVDSLSAMGDTEIRISYDEHNVYITAKCYSSGGDFLVQSLKRDYGFRASDNISFLLDTYNDKTNAYLFGMNSFGARREAWISDGGKNNDAFDSSWDNKWFGEARMYDDHWICELAIPFKILRFKNGCTSWRFNAYRNDTQNNEISIWMDMPNEIILMDMNFMSDLVWDIPLKRPSNNVSIIPYVTGSLTRDFENVDQSAAIQKFNAGLDAKISLSSNLNLDLTANPDFSQVEVDRQVTNLDRFEIFFPERRQFFLENADLFGSFGASRINPFFSRRIGVSQDTSTDNTIQNTVYGGTRLSGKISDDLRIGLMSIQAAAQRDNDLPSFNYSVMALEQKVLDRSTIAAIFVNKQAVRVDGFSDTYERYDRVLGTEFRLRSENNYWSGKTSFFKSLSPVATDHAFSSVNNIEYNRRKFRVNIEGNVVGNGYDAEVGFVPRKDIFALEPSVEFRFFPKYERINRHNLTFQSRYFYKLGKEDNDVISDFGLEESGVNVRWNVQFFNNSRLNIRADYQDLTLLSDFDPTRIQEDDIFFKAGRRFKNLEFSVEYRSDNRKPFFWRLSGLTSEFYDGRRYRLNTRLGTRYVPYGSLTLDASYNYIELGDDFETAHLWLVSPRLDITFTRKHFWTTFLQYNNQLENLSLNTRFQWRFAPASDFFLVYSENYITAGAGLQESRNRGIVAKMTYWLNL